MVDFKYIQDVLGTLTYYTQAVDLMLAAGLSAIASWQAKCTKAFKQTHYQLIYFDAKQLHMTFF